MGKPEALAVVECNQGTYGRKSMRADVHASHRKKSWNEYLASPELPQRP